MSTRCTHGTSLLSLAHRTYSRLWCKIQPCAQSFVTMAQVVGMAGGAPRAPIRSRQRTPGVLERQCVVSVNLSGVFGKSLECLGSALGRVGGAFGASARRPWGHKWVSGMPWDGLGRLGGLWGPSLMPNGSKDAKVRISQAPAGGAGVCDLCDLFGCPGGKGGKSTYFLGPRGWRGCLRLVRLVKF